MACRLTSDISKKDVHHQCSRAHCVPIAPLPPHPVSIPMLTNMTRYSLYSAATTILWSATAGMGGRVDRGMGTVQYLTIPQIFLPVSSLQQINLIHRPPPKKKLRTERPAGEVKQLECKILFLIFFKKLLPSLSLVHPSKTRRKITPQIRAICFLCTLLGHNTRLKSQLQVNR